jgi:hypothetical protein
MAPAGSTPIDSVVPAPRGKDDSSEKRSLHNVQPCPRLTEEDWGLAAPRRRARLDGPQGVTSPGRRMRPGRRLSGGAWLAAVFSMRTDTPMCGVFHS